MLLTQCEAVMTGRKADYTRIPSGTEAASVSNSKLAAWGVPADVCADVTNPGNDSLRAKSLSAWAPPAIWILSQQLCGRGL